MKKKKSSREKLEKELDKAWSEYVRRKGICAKCGSRSASVSAHHVFGRRHQATRWDVANGCPLCFAHHIHWAHRDIGGFMAWFEEYIGPDQYNRLKEAHRQITKFTVEDLEQKLKGIQELCQVQ